jgi:hypothetical protein
MAPDTDNKIEDQKPKQKKEDLSAHAQDTILDHEGESSHDIYDMNHMKVANRKEIKASVQSARSQGVDGECVRSSHSIREAFKVAATKAGRKICEANDEARLLWMKVFKDEISAQQVIFNMIEPCPVADAHIRTKVAKMISDFTVEQRFFAELEELRSLIGIGRQRQKSYRDYHNHPEYNRFEWVEGHLIETLEKTLLDAAKLADKTRDPELLKMVEWAENTLKSIYASRLERDSAQRQERQQELRRRYSP